MSNTNRSLAAQKAATTRVQKERDELLRKLEERDRTIANLNNALEESSTKSEAYKRRFRELNERFSNGTTQAVDKVKSWNWNSFTAGALVVGAVALLLFMIIATGAIQTVLLPIIILALLAWGVWLFAKNSNAGTNKQEASSPRRASDQQAQIQPSKLFKGLGSNRKRT